MGVRIGWPRNLAVNAPRARPRDAATYPLVLSEAHPGGAGYSPLLTRCYWFPGISPVNLLFAQSRNSSPDEAL